MGVAVNEVTGDRYGLPLAPIFERADGSIGSPLNHT